jgi:hypothetical protein
MEVSFDVLIVRWLSVAVIVLSKLLNLLLYIRIKQFHIYLFTKQKPRLTLPLNTRCLQTHNL